MAYNKPYLYFQAKSGADFGNAWAIKKRLCADDPGIAMVSSDMEGISEAEAACFLLDSESGKNKNKSICLRTQSSDHCQ